MRRIFIATSLVLFLVLGGGIWYLSCTEGGLHRLLSASKGYIPGKLSFTSLAGRLIGPIEIAGLTYRAEGLTISIDQFMIDWKPRELFSLRAHILKIEASGVEVLPQEGKEEPPSEPQLTDLRLPLEIVIDDARASDISIKSPDSGDALELSEVTLGANLGRESFRIRRLNVTAPLFVLSLTGELSPKGDYPLNIGVEWTLRLAGYSPFTGSGRLSGSLALLEVIQEIDSPAKARLDANIFEPLGKVRWEASLRLDAFQGTKIREGWPAVSLTGEVASSGTFEVFDLEGSFSASTPQYGNVKGDFLGGHSDGEWKLVRLLLAVPGTNTRISLRGGFAQAAGTPTFSVDGQWRDVSWPLNGKEAEYASPEGTVSAKGAPEDFSFRAEARLEGKSIPAGSWALWGVRKGGEVSLERVLGRLMDGEISGSGVLRWQPEISWNVAIDGKSIDPGALAADWPGSLSFTVQSKGKIGKEAPQVKFDIEDLKGELRGYPVRGSAEIAVEGNSYTFPRFELRSGTALITVSGEVSDSWDLAWEIDAEELRELIPDGQGSVRGKGRLSGPRPAPRAEARLSGKDISAGTSGAGTFDADIAIDLSDTESSRIEVTASGIQAGTWQFDNFSLRGAGKLTSHDLSAAIRRGRENLALSLSGRYENRSWEGLLEKIDLTTEKFGTWSLLEEKRVFLSEVEVSTGELCFVSGVSRICSRVKWLGEKGLDGEIHIVDLPLSLFRLALPEKVTLEGTLAGTIEGSYIPGGMLTGTAGLTTSPGEVTFLLEEGKAVKLPFAKSVFDGSLNERALQARLEVSVSDEEFLRSTLILPLFSPMKIQPQKQDIRGRVQISLEEPGLIPALFPKLENTTGKLRGDLALSGTLASPLFTGEAALSNASADIPGLGTRIEDVRIAASSDGSGVIKTDGQARSRGGTVQMLGTIDVRPRKGQIVTARITGERFEVIKTPEAWILLSPDLTVRLENKILRLDGQLEIPEATITPRDLSGAVTPSRDVTVIREDEKEKKEEEFKIYSNVRLILGEKVSFDGFGLSARITGSILAVGEPEGLTTATGELKILGGKYKAYGQSLEVEKGRVIFFGGPIDDPGLDIRAVRRIDEVVAGVDVSGTVKSPRLTLFSSPAMDQSDVLSYLLFGRPVNRISSGEGQQLQKAALSAGLSGGDLIAKKIGALFGLEEVALEGGSEQKEASLILGKYLSPRLYVSYGIGLFEPISTYRIRYNISSKWLVQTEYGLNSGADLIYTIER